jgi:hypothetical protein
MRRDLSDRSPTEEITMHNRYKVADIDNLKNELELLPETERENRQIGLKDAMKVLGPVLREMRERRGYTNDQLLGVLRERGINIGKSTLNEYLRTKRRAATSGRGTGECATSPLASGQGGAENGPELVSGDSVPEPSLVLGARGALTASAAPGGHRSTTSVPVRAPR